MKTERAIAVRRMLAFVMDWLVVVLWGGVLFGAVLIATGGNPPRPESPWKAQTLGFFTMTMPVTLYFAFCESSAMRASLGKRILELVVSRETGERLLLRSALLRNALKFVAWEFGHTVAQQAAFSGEGGFPWLCGPTIVALVGPVWWLVAMIATGRTPYDRLASAQVRLHTRNPHVQASHSSASCNELDRGGAVLLWRPRIQAAVRVSTGRA